ncbi:major capsid protein [Neisseria perflava]|jgi:putative membrane protein|uniref:major capsid protein n=1 Tax=Neisseria perflava TaxID=33053 RepID=UPI00316A17DC
MKLANLKKVAVGATLATASALSMADGIGDVTSTITGEIGKVAPVVSAVGVALIGVYVLIKAFRLVTGFMRG